MYQLGDIARADIIIPMDAVIEDETATQARRAEAKAKALPVYRYNPSLHDDQATRLKEVAHYDPVRNSGTWSAYPYTGPMFNAPLRLDAGADARHAQIAGDDQA